MLAKLGLVILIILFGTCTFIAGTMAPEAWRKPVAAFGEKIFGAQPAASPVAASASGTQPTAGSLPSAASASPPSTAQKAGPVRLDSLLVTAAVKTPEPAAGKPAYALQLGQFATEQGAQSALQRFKAAGLGLPFAGISGMDSENEPWTVVAIGRFTTPEAARSSAPRVQEVLGLHDTPVIRLPPSSKPPS